MESLSIIAPNAAGKKKKAAGFSTGSYSFLAQLSPARFHSSVESRRWRDGGNAPRKRRLNRGQAFSVSENRGPPLFMR
jgi:hypothetical protein